MEGFFVKSNENTFPKGRALMQIYGVIYITKRVNCCSRRRTKTWCQLGKYVDLYSSTHITYIIQSVHEI